MKPIAFAIILLILAGCGNKPGAVAPPDPVVEGERIVFAAGSPQLKGLVSAAAEPTRSEQLQLNGRLVWDEERTVRVFAPLAGRIVGLRAQPGQTVRAGDTLALVSSPDFGQSQAEERRAVADYGVADKALARARELHQQGIVAARDLQQAEADFARAAAERDRTQARARLYGGQGVVDQQFALRAPLGGVVVERNANPGQEVRPDQAQPGSPALFVISDPTRLWVQLELSEAALAQVGVGMEFVLKGAGIADDGVRGRIEWVADGLDAVTRTTRARGTVANAGRRLKAEMFVTADIEVPQAETLRVPATAVILLGDQQYVFVDEGQGRYVRRPVVAAAAGLGRMRIRSGLAAGERIVTDGALLLQQLLTFAAK